MFLTKLFNSWHLSGAFQLNVGLLALGVCFDVLSISSVFSASFNDIFVALAALIVACFTVCSMLFFQMPFSFSVLFFMYAYVETAFIAFGWFFSFSVFSGLICYTTFSPNTI